MVIYLIYLDFYDIFILLNSRVKALSTWNQQRGGKMRNDYISLGLIVILLGWSCSRLIPLEPKNSSPQIPQNIFPANDTTDIQVNLNFIWTGGDPDAKDTVRYDFYLTAEHPQPELIATDLSDTSFQYNSLNYNTIYYWKVIAKDQNGSTVSSPVWSFSTRYENNNPPNLPDHPNPESGINSLSIEGLKLHWRGDDPDSFSRVSYDVFLGKQAEGLTKISESQLDTFYLMDMLEFNAKYFWKVISKDHYGLTAAGPTWNFSTEPAELLFEENFDAYPTGGYPETAIWTINKAGADLCITDSISWNANGKSVCFIDSTETGSCFLATRLPSRSAGMLEFCWRITTSSDVFGVRMYSQQSQLEQLGPQLSIREGLLQYYDDNYNWQTVCKIDSMSWYRIKLVYSCQQNYYKIFVNEILMIEKANWIGTSVSTLDIIYFMTFDNRICRGAFLDEIKFYAGTNLK